LQPVILPSGSADNMAIFGKTLAWRLPAAKVSEAAGPIPALPGTRSCGRELMFSLVIPHVWS
jgi:hypothetical protein